MANTYECDLKVLSPVYIGSGNDYGASEYISQMTQFKGKSKKIKLPTFKRINLSKYYSSLDDDKKDEFIANLSNSNFDLESFDSKISNKYRKYLVFNKCDESLKPKKIEENIKSLNKAYIPGSSIKGAIKTAILYNSLDFNDIKWFMGKFDKRNNSDSRIINSIFSSRSGNAAQSSLMKFLRISDSTSAKKVSVYDVFSVMAETPFSNKKYSRGKRVVITYLETIDKGNNLKFNLSTNFNKQIYRTLGLNDKEYLIDLDYIKKSIYKFSKEYISHELEFAEEYEISYLLKFYKKQEKHNTPDKPLLKIGGGSGFLATTIGLKIKGYDESNGTTFFENVRKSARGKSHDYCFPKSRKVTFKGGYPLGWVQLAFNEIWCK